MGLLDPLLVLIVVGMVLLGAAQRFLRSIFLLGALYISTLTGALFYKDLAHRLQLVGGKTPALMEGIVFLVLFYLLFIIFFFVLRSAFPDTRLMKLGFLDAVLGAVVGAVLGLLMAGMTLNTFGVMVSKNWEPRHTFLMLQLAYTGSGMRGILGTVTSLYAYLFYPFFWGSGFPLVLVPF